MSKSQGSNWRILTQLAFFTLLLSAGIGLILASELLFLPRVSVEAGTGGQRRHSRARRASPLSARSRLKKRADAPWPTCKKSMSRWIAR